MKKNIKFLIAILLVIVVGGFIFYQNTITKKEDRKINLMNQNKCWEQDGFWFENECIIYDKLTAAILKESCNQFGGIWLENYKTNECQIEGVSYFDGAWEDLYSPDFQINQTQESCVNSGGIWLNNEANGCNVNGFIYEYSDWEKIDTMQDSCVQYGGEFIGGPNFACQIFGETYYNNNWVKVAFIPEIKQRCMIDGGDWIDTSRECRNVTIDWCMRMVEELEDVDGLAYNKDRSACYVNF